MDTQVDAPQGQRTISVQVRYLGAHRPYVDGNASPSQTVGALKEAVLQFFGLQESGPGGKVYVLSRDKVPVTDMAQSLEHLASGSHEVKLDLLEQLEQG